MWAFFLDWSIPASEIAFWEIRTSVKGATTSRFSCNNLPIIALWTSNTDLRKQWFSVFAFGIPGTSQKLSKTSPLNHHIATAIVTWNIRNLIFHFNLFYQFMRFFQILGETLIKISQNS